MEWYKLQVKCVVQHTVVYTVSTPVYEYTYIVTNQAKECPTAHMRYMGS